MLGRIAPGALLLLLGGGVFCQSVLRAPVGDVDGLALSPVRMVITVAAAVLGCVLLEGAAPFRPPAFLWAWILVGLAVVALVAGTGGLDPGRRFTLVWRGVAYLGFLPYLSVLVRAGKGAVAGEVGALARARALLLAAGAWAIGLLPFGFSIGILAGLVAGVLTQPLGPPPTPGVPMGR